MIRDSSEGKKGKSNKQWNSSLFKYFPLGGDVFQHIQPLFLGGIKQDNWNFQTSVPCLICVFFSEITSGFTLREFESHTNVNEAEPGHPSNCAWNHCLSMSRKHGRIVFIWGCNFLSRSTYNLKPQALSDVRGIAWVLVAQAWAGTSSNRKLNLKSNGFSRMKRYPKKKKITG